MENQNVINDCNKHAQTSEGTISYKHVNFCGMHRPCEKNQTEEEYCITTGMKKLESGIRL